MSNALEDLMLLLNEFLANHGYNQTAIKGQ